jgi:hypothetical protein
MRKIAIFLTLSILLILIVRIGVSTWHFKQGVQIFNTTATQSSVTELKKVQTHFDQSYSMRSNNAALKNSNFIKWLLQELTIQDAQTFQKKSKKWDSETPTPPVDPTNNEPSSDINSSWSTQQKMPTTSSGETDMGQSTTSSNQEIQSRINDLKKLQRDKGEYTRPDGTAGAVREPSLIEQFFSNDPFFGGKSEAGPEDY